MENQKQHYRKEAVYALINSVDVWLIESVLESELDRNARQPRTICLSSVCTHTDEIWRGYIFFILSQVGTSQCRCVWLCIYAWNKVKCVVCPFLTFLFSSKVFRLRLWNCYCCFNFFAQFTKGEKLSWVLAGSQTFLRQYRPSAVRFQHIGPSVCRWHQTLLSVQSNKSIVTVLVRHHEHSLCNCFFFKKKGIC